MAKRDDSREASDALAALLELEDDIARRIAHTRESAELTVAEAHSARERALSRRPEELREALGKLHARLEAAHRAELTEIDEQARKEVKRFDALDDEAIALLADALVKELMTLILPEEGAR